MTPIPTCANLSAEDLAKYKKIYQEKNPTKIKKAPTPAAQYKNQNFQASHAGFHGHHFDTRMSGGSTRHGLTNYQDLLILDHYALRQNVRKLTHTSLHTRVILKRELDSVVGNGLKWDPTPDFDILGIKREEAEKWGENFKSGFDLWCKSKGSDLTGRNNFYQNTRFYGWQYGRDGDVFVRFSYSDDPNLLNPLQISFIDPNQIRGDEFTFSSGPDPSNGFRFNHRRNGIGNGTGIVFDKNGKEEAYKVWIDDPANQGRFKNVEIDAFDEKTGRPLMTHGFDPEWAGQQRGIPELSHAVQNLQNITQFTTNTIAKGIDGAGKTFIVQNDQQDPSSLGFDQLDDGRAGPPVVADPSTATGSTGPTNLGVDGITFRDIPELTTTEPNTMILGASKGDKLVPVASNMPAENTGDFVDGEFSYIAASKSMPLSIAKMIFGKSHSASRGELGLYETVREIKKDDIAADFLDLVIFAYASEEIAAGRLQAPGFSDPRIRAAWLKGNWRMKPLPDVDPLKTVMTISLANELGISDLDTDAKAYNGSDGKTNRTKLTTQTKELPTDPFGIKKLAMEMIKKDDAEESKEADDNNDDNNEEEDE